MAKMYPKSLSLYKHTDSEQKVFEALKKQLDDRISVFFSVSWIEEINGKKQESECDFLIFDPYFGFLTIEVKGGKELIKEGDKWSLKLNDDSIRELNRSPNEQAEESMRYFTKLYEKEYLYSFKGVFGSASIFPNFVIKSTEILSHRPHGLILDYNDMDKLSESIRRIFLFYKGSKKTFMSADQIDNFLGLVNKRVAMAAAAGSLIKDKELELESINRVQDNYIYFIKEYNQALISGGAGTGKTWIGMKIAKKYAEEHKKVLMVCKSKPLSLFISKHIDNPNVSVYSLFDFLNKEGVTTDGKTTKQILDSVEEDSIRKFDCIIVDEAQDFDENIALLIRMHLSNDLSSLYVFYDETQNVYDVNFKTGFFIEQRPFHLRENLRNTASISRWAVEKTNVHTDIITNQISGPVPEHLEFRNLLSCIAKLESIVLNLVENEYVQKDSITILADLDNYNALSNTQVGKWILSDKNDDSKIKISTVENYKGLEANVIIYIHNKQSSDAFDYVAYTRAKYYLYDLIIK